MPRCLNVPLLLPPPFFRRGVPAAAAANDEAEEADDEDPNPLEAVDTAAERKKKAKVGALWEQLQQKAGSGGGSKAKPVSLASLTREAPKSQKSNPDMVRSTHLPRKASDGSVHMPLPGFLPAYMFRAL